MNKDTLETNKPMKKLVMNNMKKKVKRLRNETGSGKPYSRNLISTKITKTQLDDIENFLKRQEKLTGRNFEDLLAQTLSREQVRS